MLSASKATSRDATLVTIRYARYRSTEAPFLLLFQHLPEDVSRSLTVLQRTDLALSRQTFETDGNPNLYPPRQFVSGTTGVE